MNQLVAGHPVGRTRATRPATIILAKIWRVGSPSLALPRLRAGVEPGGRLYGPWTAPAVWPAAADSGLQSVQTAWTAADSRQTSPALHRAAVERLHRHYNGIGAPPMSLLHSPTTLFISDCISASWAAWRANSRARCSEGAAANTLQYNTLQLPFQPQPCGKVKNAGEQRCGGFGEKCSSRPSVHCPPPRPRPRVCETHFGEQQIVERP